ncbi:MAG: hypothetical protein AAB225_24810, partial [Acidobacteriota bacterium]
ATTALCAASRGHDVTTTEINPFLVWFGRAKTARYSGSQVRAAQDAAAAALTHMVGGCAEPVAAPPLHNIERWWKPDELRFLCSLKGALESSLGDDQVSSSLLMVAFCRTLIRLSNAAFNQQSMSFKADDYNLTLLDHHGSDRVRTDLFMEDVGYVLDSALDNPAGHGVVVYGDARKIEKLVPGLYDVVVTSPPYPNRMSYIRELRPYMYWLGFLKDPKQAAELDWASIGGTWGAATSRLSEWRGADDGFRPPYFRAIIDRIADERNTSGHLLSNYVLKYWVCARIWRSAQLAGS